VGAVIFAVFCGSGKKRALRNGYRVACLLYLLAVCGLVGLIYDDAARNTALRVLLNVRAQHSDVLPLLFGEGFRLEALIAITVISLVTVIVGHSVVRVFTKESRMF
jgi:hypothetical protein